MDCEGRVADNAIVDVEMALVAGRTKGGVSGVVMMARGNVSITEKGAGSNSSEICWLCERS